MLVKLTCFDANRAFYAQEETLSEKDTAGSVVHELKDLDRE